MGRGTDKEDGVANLPALHGTAFSIHGANSVPIKTFAYELVILLFF